MIVSGASGMVMDSQLQIVLTFWQGNFFTSLLVFEGGKISLLPYSSHIVQCSNSNSLENGSIMALSRLLSSETLKQARARQFSSSYNTRDLENLLLEKLRRLL